MGSSSPEIPDLQFPSAFQPEEQIILPPPASVARREPKLRYIILFLLTLATTTLVGAGHWASFVIGFTSQTLAESGLTLLLHGLWYSLSILAILGAHEFGHYYACRYYGVDSSLPYFLPVPPQFFTGTLGAVIRIRQPIPGKRALFDIGIAGPIAGFVVAVPLLLIGMHLSDVVQIPQHFNGDLLELGEPLLFKA